MKNNKSLLIGAGLILVALLAFLTLSNRQEQIMMEQTDDQAETAVGDFAENDQLDFAEGDEAVLDDQEMNSVNETAGEDVQGVVDEQDVSDKTASSDQEEPKFVFFYGDTCPYCHDVMDWMDETGVESMLDITRKEVYNDAKNSEQMNLALRNCGSSSSGVPMMYTNDKECIVGSTPIIDHLSEVAGI